MRVQIFRLLAEKIDPRHRCYGANSNNNKMASILQIPIYTGKGCGAGGYHYKDAYKDGIHQTLYNNGTIQSTWPYSGGKRNGTVFFYSQAGQKTAEYNYKDDKTHGSYKLYRPNGDLFIEGTCVNGMREGIEIEYNNNGKVAIESSFVNDVLDGPMKVFDSRGNFRVFTYKGGNLIR